MKFRFLSILAALLFVAMAARSQTTAFTYQGQLSSNSVPANGLYDLRFQLFNVSSNAVGNPFTNSPTGVTNGLFTATLNFGTSVFDGSDRWLQIAVRNYGDTNDYTPLSPLQPITSVPYAIRSLNAVNATNAMFLTTPLQGTNITGIISVTNLPVNVAFLNSNQTFTGSDTFSGAVTANNSGNTFSGAFSGDGSGLLNIPATVLTGTLPDARLSANVALQSNAVVNFAGSVGASNFVGAGHGLTNVPGAFFWVIPTNGLMYPNVGYICTNDFTPVTLILPTTNSASIGDTYKVVGAGDAGWIIAQTNGETIFSANLSDSIGDNWTARDSVRAWTGIASSADGTKLVACVKGGAIYTSTNSGATWTATSSGNKNWSSVASSVDGTKLVGTVGDNVSATGQIYTNDNSGAGSWTAKASVQQWVSVASSADGTKLIAANYSSGASGGIYISSNSGGTWTFPASRPFCSAVASSADGTKLVATVFGNVAQGIYTSTNSGSTWQQCTNSGDWVAVASSADGTRLVAAADPASGTGKIFVSANGGATWSTTSPSQKWTAVASSADGSRLAAVGSDGVLYTSPDSGSTWLQRSVTNAPWAGITSSADGSKLAAVANGGFIYTSSQGSTTTGANGYLSGAQHSAIELIYTGNGNFLPLNHEGTIRAY